MKPRYVAWSRRELLRAALLGLGMASRGVGRAQAAGSGAPAESLPAPLLVEVQIDGRGPFRFIVDTGANRTALAAHLPPQLGLRLAAGADVALRGAVAAVQVPTVAIGRLECGAARLEGRQLPVLPRTALVSADGLLGADAFAGCELAVDFRARAASVVAGRRTEGQGSTVAGRVGPAPAREPLAAEFTRDGLVAVAAQVDGKAVRAIIDTGAQLSVGDLRLRRLARATAASAAGVMPRDASGVMLAAERALLPALQLARRTSLPAAPAAFAELPIFERWGDREVPSLLLGLDRLAQLRQLVIDYGGGRVSVG